MLQWHSKISRLARKKWMSGDTAMLLTWCASLGLKLRGRKGYNRYIMAIFSHCLHNVCLGVPICCSQLTNNHAFALYCNCELITESIWLACNLVQCTCNTTCTLCCISVEWKPACANCNTSQLPGQIKGTKLLSLSVLLACMPWCKQLGNRVFHRRLPGLILQCN